jgi:hypothetical protein
MALNLKHTTILGALALAAIAATAGHARAFTVENQGAGSSGASANFGDPDDKLLQNFGGGGSSSSQGSTSLSSQGSTMTNNGQSGTSLQFGTPITTTNGQGIAIGVPAAQHH